jgi:uncharacterized membrane protein
MDLELVFVIGLIVAAFSIPALVNAFSDRRWPRGSALALIAGVGAAGFVVRQEPDLFTLDRVDDVFVSVVARYIN